MIYSPTQLVSIISAPKYFQKEEIVDDSKAERTVKLKPLPAGWTAKPPPPPPKSATTAAPTASKQIGEFQDPWKKK